MARVYSHARSRTRLASQGTVRSGEANQRFGGTPFTEFKAAIAAGF
jgi:hypothetical protein